MTDILQAAQRAYDETAFYEGLYETRPTEAREIPFINHAHYHQAAGLLDCITDRSLVAGALPAFHRNVRRFPFNVVESETEQKQRHQRFIYALNSLGLGGHPDVFLIIADDSSGPFAGEFVTHLAWEHHRSPITFHQGPIEQLHDDIHCHEPGNLICISIPSRNYDLSSFTGPVITVQHVDQPILPIKNTLLACDEIGIFAGRKSPDDPFTYDAENLKIEATPNSGLWAFTTLKFGITPFIRYCPSQFPTQFDA